MHEYSIGEIIYVRRGMFSSSVYKARIVGIPDQIFTAMDQWNYILVRPLRGLFKRIRAVEKGTTCPIPEESIMKLEEMMAKK